MPLSEALKHVTSAPAAVLGIAAGDLAVGRDADLCIFDAERYWKVDAGSLKSQGKNSPFTGLELAGRVRYTLLAGQTVYRNGN